MKTFINNHTDITFSKATLTFNKASKTVSELLKTPEIRFYRRILTFRRLANQILRMPQKKQIVRIQERTAKASFENTENEVFYWKKLDKNIIAEHRKFKNKHIISVKTDINYRFLIPI